MVVGRLGVRGSLAVKGADLECENANERAQDRRLETAVDPVPDHPDSRKHVTRTIVLVRRFIRMFSERKLTLWHVSASFVVKCGSVGGVIKLQGL